ncbi:hypothetical protein DBR37_00525 [Herminiimonas sp. KBW02]|uniref:hypothetical protein n=1 Tax=Herminiimonas sp. KBW02 TaxID=2153363 RepID=UPI000F59592B|nr:hypothetical protein [Herminiimonas sp. KBW02]RQO38420.1 hypothetical protein DBR37_00525 [Herminiimonas sp. KBW02]
MKQIFYALWFVLTAAFSCIALLMVATNLNWVSVAVLAIVLFYAVCFFRLLKACYGRDAVVHEAKKWYWWSWILLSIAVVLIKLGSSMMITGDYIGKSGTNGWLSMTALLNWMGDLVAPWLPGLIILLTGGLLFAICVRNIIRYVSQNVDFKR